MLNSSPDTDNEIGSESLVSRQSSMSSCDRSSSLSRVSFEALDLPLAPLAKIQSSKPHRSSDPAWEALRSASDQRKDGLSFRDFKLVRRVGSGDIGNVYLCRLRISRDCYYAMKIVDNKVLLLKNKQERAATEANILKMLDHPFLPTLYAEFKVSHFSCVVTEFCPGGDLHSLRHKQPGKRFSLRSARFYAAEALLAMEYLHMLGIIYRDLKPENILLRSDGHIMLSDFDLSLLSRAYPSVQSFEPSRTKLCASATARSAISCLPIRFRPLRVLSAPTVPQFVAEPVSARSCSFVGTHEYVSPEVAAGLPHGNAVDWWAFGVFLYELIYGLTPFAGDSNEETLRNIIKKPLAFPGNSPVSALEGLARNLISGLLVKDPSKRVGCDRGAAEVKAHPFFKGLNFALMRSSRPPDIPRLRRTQTINRAAFDYF